MNGFNMHPHCPLQHICSSFKTKCPEKYLDSNQKVFEIKPRSIFTSRCSAQSSGLLRHCLPRPILAPGVNHMITMNKLAKLGDAIAFGTWYRSYDHTNDADEKLGKWLWLILRHQYQHHKTESTFILRLKKGWFSKPYWISPPPKVSLASRASLGGSRKSCRHFPGTLGLISKSRVSLQKSSIRVEAHSGGGFQQSHPISFLRALCSRENSFSRTQVGSQEDRIKQIRLSI